MPAGQRDQSAAALPTRGLATTTARFTLRGCFCSAFRRARDRSPFFHREWLKLWRIRTGFVHWHSARRILDGNGAPCYFGPVDRWASRLQLAAESIVIPVLAMV